MPDPVKLDGLEFPECQGKGGIAKRARDSGLGHGAAAGRTFDIPFRGTYAETEGTKGGRVCSSMGVPLPSGDTGGESGSVRDVQYGTAERKYTYIFRRSTIDGKGNGSASWHSRGNVGKKYPALYGVPLLCEPLPERTEYTGIVGTV